LRLDGCVTGNAKIYLAEFFQVAGRMFVLGNGGRCKCQASAGDNGHPPPHVSESHGFHLRNQMLVLEPA
jgi:hypothetical protein